MNDEIPNLEDKCQECNGSRGNHDPEHGWIDCYKCNGAGFIPTEAGARIIALIRHNSRMKISAQTVIR